MGIIERVRRRRHGTAVSSAVPGADGALDAIRRDTTGDPVYGGPLALAAGRAEVGAERCAYCDRPIRHVRGQGWVHGGDRGTFGCRDTNPTGMFTGTYATPSVPERSARRPPGRYPADPVEGPTAHGGRG